MRILGGILLVVGIILLIVSIIRFKYAISGSDDPYSMDYHDTGTFFDVFNGLIAALGIGLLLIGYALLKT